MSAYGNQPQPLPATLDTRTVLLRLADWGIDDVALREDVRYLDHQGEYRELIDSRAQALLDEACDMLDLDPRSLLGSNFYAGLLAEVVGMLEENEPSPFIPEEDPDQIPLLP